MMRSAVVVLCVVCVGTLLSEAFGLAFLWYRGQLTAETLQDIRGILAGQDQDDIGMDEENKTVAPSSEDIARKRITRILELTARDSEQTAMKTMIDEKTSELVATQKAFEERSKKFYEDLEMLDAQNTDEAVEQAREILAKSPAVEAVKELMVLTSEESIIIVRGMPAKTIAKILQSFDSADQEQEKRASEIFRAIMHGEPKNQLIDAAGAILEPAANDVTTK